jgi:hypothetical protein
MISNSSRYGFRALYSAFLALGLLAMVGCSAGVARQSTLAEARSGQRPQEDDMTLRAGEIRGEVAEVDPVHREIRVIWMDGGRRDIIPYDITYTRVLFHGLSYPIDSLETGDLVAFVPSPRTTPYIDTIRLQIPVQARVPGSPYARATAPIPAARAQMIEGTVERIDYDRGVFDVRPRNGGRMVTVALPYNARGADVDNFRRLRNGDYVRVEGEFVNADNVQLMAFVR